MLKTLALNSFFGLIAAALVFSLSCPMAYAHTHHTADICSATASDVCAHLGYDEINSTNEAKFMLDMKPSKANLSLITNVTVELKMDMGGHSHGSSPVTLTRLDAAHIEVSKAYFPMVGMWTVVVGFDYASAKHQIVFPIDVK